MNTCDYEIQYIWNYSDGWGNLYDCKEASL